MHHRRRSKKKNVRVRRTCGKLPCEDEDPKCGCAHQYTIRIFLKCDSIWFLRKSTCHMVFKKKKNRKVVYSKCTKSVFKMVLVPSFKYRLLCITHMKIVRLRFSIYSVVRGRTVLLAFFLVFRERIWKSFCCGRYRHRLTCRCHCCPTSVDRA